MKAGFYPKLAFLGIRKNKIMYLPYILTCAGMVMMHYIIIFLQHSDTVTHLSGGVTLQEMLKFGGSVISIFSCVFLFYTNSFLMKRRRKEFGLYNILGIGKTNIVKMLFWEYFIIYVISMAAGLISGIIISKLAELGLINIIQTKLNYNLYISVSAVIRSITIFGLIFVLLFLNSLRQVKFTSAVMLLKSESVGEKPPKGNWFIGILGVVLLGVAYYLALTIKNPMQALEVFFIAVILVIIGTYLIMIAGSVLVCRLLQKKKGYYYKPAHFVSVSQMAYRMKRNGAGLASICILATMVLIIISSTLCMFVGEEDSLNFRYKREFNMRFGFDSRDGISDMRIDGLKKDIKSNIEKQGISALDVLEYRHTSAAGILKEDTVNTKSEENFNYASSYAVELFFMDISDYNRMSGVNEVLEEDEVLLYTNMIEYGYNTIKFNDGDTYKIKKQIDKFAVKSDMSMIVPGIVVIVPDLNNNVYGVDNYILYNYCFNIGDGGAAKAKMKSKFADMFTDGGSLRDAYDIVSFYYEDREEGRESFYSLYGGLFYMGIILSMVFIFATVLIIYYKQISEGYEDCLRFGIMKKVGMTGREIRKSINSQLLMVFFMPLAFAAVHLIFAFPIIRKLLLMFNLNNVPLFVATTIISFLVFGIFYILTYRITSNVYYNIVNGNNEKQEK